MLAQGCTSYCVPGSATRDAAIPATGHQRRSLLKILPETEKKKANYDFSPLFL